MGTASSSRATILAEVGSLPVAEFDVALQRVLKADASALDVERVGLWQLSHDPFRLTLACNYVKSDDHCERGMELRADAYPKYFTALDTNPLIVADDAQSDPRTAEFAESYLRPNGIVSMLDAPVWCGGRLVGVVCHEHVGRPRRWTHDEQTFALSIASTVSAMLELRMRRDIEAQVRTLVADVAAARRLADDRAEMLALVSHELRSPLATIHTTTALLDLETPPTAATTRLRLGRIQRSVRLMSRLIADLLDASRLDGGHALSLDLALCPIDEVLAEAAEQAQLNVGDRRVRIATHFCVPGVSLRIDRQRVGQAVANLLDNAVRFSPAGGTVQLTSAALERGVRIAVKDEGPGVRPEDRARVFDRYWRGPQGKTGLGLYIAKAIVEGHGGAIRVAGGESGGAVFEIDLPIA